MQLSQQDTQSLMESATSIEERWVFALGRYVFLFAQLESLTHWLIARFAPSEEAAMQAASDPLTRRLRSCKWFISASHKITDEMLQADWYDWLNKASAVARERNDRLHNPVGISFACAGDGSLSVHSEIVVKRRMTKSITIEEMEESLENLRSLLRQAGRLKQQTLLLDL